MARRLLRRRRHPGALRSFTLLATALAMALPAGEAIAEPRAERLARLEARVERLNQDADRLVEDYLEQKLALERTTAELRQLDQQARAAQRALDELRSRVSERAAAAYMHGPGSTLASTLLADSPIALAERMQVLNVLSQQESELLTQAELARASLRQQKAALESKRREQAAGLARLAQQKARVERTIAEVEALLEERRALERQARAAAERERQLTPASAGAPGRDPGQAPLTASPAVKASGRAAAAVAYAYKQLGKPYRWGAAGPDAFDCSGLTMMAWQQGGVSLPHSSRAQARVGRRITRAQLRPGDLIFYYNPISHVAIYVGGGKQIAATHTGDYVRLQPVRDNATAYTRPG